MTLRKDTKENILLNPPTTEEDLTYATDTNELIYINPLTGLIIYETQGNEIPSDGVELQILAKGNGLDNHFVWTDANFDLSHSDLKDIVVNEHIDWTNDQGDSFVDPGATAQDDVDGNITDFIQVTQNDVNASVPGNYSITYEVTDSAGNNTSVIRNVNVSSPVVAPIITLIGDNPIVLSVGDSFVDPGATAVDSEDGDITADIIATSNVDTSASGGYQVIYTVTDSDDNTTTKIRRVVVSLENTITYNIDSIITSGTDDAEQRQAGSVYLDSSDIELVESVNNMQIVGFRFQNMNIPPEAVITNAYIQFQTKRVDNITITNLTIEGEKNINASTFSTVVDNISDRIKTTANTLWSPQVWNTIGERGADQRTSELAPIVQEIISQVGWVEGNSIAFIMSGVGRRVAESYDANHSGAAQLYVEYTLESVDEPPVITLLGDNPMNIIADNIVIDPNNIAPSISSMYSNGTKSANWILNPSNGEHQSVSISDNCTVSILAPTNSYILYLHVYQSSATKILTLPTGEWENGIIKANTQTLDAHDLIIMHYTGSGWVFDMKQNLS